MASKKTKMMTPTTPTRRMPRGPIELIERVERYIDSAIDSSKRAVAESIKNQQEAFTKAAAALSCGNDQAAWSGCYEASQTYWNLDTMNTEIGKLTALMTFSKAVAQIKDENLNATVTLQKIAARNADIAICDNNRSENSTNPYSNAKSASAGEGRGRVYRDIHQVLESYLAEAAEWTVEANATVGSTPLDASI